MTFTKFFTLEICSLLLLTALVCGQQSYVNNHQFACYDSTWYHLTKGYVCNGPPLCQSYLTFRSEPPYNTPAKIAGLLDSNATLIASINEIASVNSLVPTGTPLLVPISCSCSGSYYQYNVTYMIKLVNGMTNTYLSVANNTYQALSTCQAIMSQNANAYRRLTGGLNVVVPIRCACPTSNQTNTGVKYLLTYPTARGDTISGIAETFSVSGDSILYANNISSVIKYFDMLLIPLTTEPTRFKTQILPPPPPPPPPPSVNVPSGGSDSSNKWIFVGVVVGSAILVLVLVFIFCVCRKKLVPASTDIKNQFGSLPKDNKPSVGIHYIESLTIYTFEDLYSATSGFSESNKIKGSVYRGLFQGDTAAVKVMREDISGEINLLKKINHTNIIRLSGFCLHEGNSYLVYEYAANNSLGDWLHSEKKNQTPSSLSWKQRVQIAFDVGDGLNYLHSYMNPPYIHKNLRCSNILLDQSLRAKISNFRFARVLKNGDLYFTKHVVGSRGYMAPEYIENGVITPKLDVFSFGVVVLELLSGREVADERKEGEEGLLYAKISEVLEGENVRDKLKGFMDGSLGNEYPLDLAFKLAQLAKVCVAHDLNDRPSSYILGALSIILSAALDWDPSDLLDGPTSDVSAV